MPFILKKKNPAKITHHVLLSRLISSDILVWRHSWVLHDYHTVEFLKMTGQLFYRMFVIWIRLLFLHDSGYVSLAGISPKACWVLPLHRQEARGSNVPSTEDGPLDMFKAVSANVSFPAKEFFVISILWAGILNFCSLLHSQCIQHRLTDSYFLAWVIVTQLPSLIGCFKLSQVWPAGQVSSVTLFM